MNESRAIALQMCPFSDYLEAALHERFETVRWFELQKPDQASWLKQHAPQVRAIVTAGHVGCSNELVQALPKLGIVAINGVGVDKVDLQLARSRGVRVSTTPGTLAEDVADLAVGLLFALLRNIPAADAYVRAGKWANGDFPLGRKVTGRRFGILGLGAIGSAIATRLAAFGPVVYTGPRRKPAPYEFIADLMDLARSSDVLVVSCPATAATHHMVDARVIDALGPTGYLINIARGAVVDELALIAALDAGRLAGAALDVFQNEPHVPEAFRASSRVVLTPHIASATVETRTQMANVVLANLDAYLAGGTLPTAVV
jgi:lactate dehydrogenase-like 2-hydroxyacid dehydrogenase